MEFARSYRIFTVVIVVVFRRTANGKRCVPDHRGIQLLRGRRTKKRVLYLEITGTPIIASGSRCLLRNCQLHKAVDGEANCRDFATLMHATPASSLYFALCNAQPPRPICSTTHHLYS